MAKLSFVVAVLALIGASSAKSTSHGKDSKTVRATCVDSHGQLQPEGSTWLEGVNGCLAITCINGTSVGVSSCMCTYPDGTTGKDNDVWTSIPTCTTCNCLYGSISCSPLLNCLLPPTTTITIAPSATFTCSVPEEGIVLNAGDMYINDGLNCTCTATGLLCSGIAYPTVPGVTTDLHHGQCFMGFLGFVDSSVSDEVVPNGYVFTDEHNRCVCTDGIFICEYIDHVSAVAPTLTIEPTYTHGANLDCDVGEGIVLNGDPYSSACGAACICVNGKLECGDCPAATTATATVAPTGPSTVVCLASNGQTVENGDTYLADECTNCTCINGVFTCVKVCKRDCTTSSNEVITHGSTKTTTCQSCKCSDATLTCTDKCEGQSCKVPNSKNTVERGEKEKVDSCNTCSCSSSLKLTCTSSCSSSSSGSSCVCNGRTLRSGKSTSSKCEECSCKDGNVTCKKTC